jgi:ribonuclease D
MRKYRPIRAEHRARSHESAHSDATLSQESTHRIPDHPLVPRDSAPLITTQADLAELIAHVRSIGSFAYDSEFIGELTYIPKLCLIQVSTCKRVALIDPLAKIELKPFWELLCDGSVEKVVHAGQQDLEPVFRYLGRPPCNVFDTQIAAGFIGIAYPVALSKLAKEILGAWLGKGLTFSHWDQRPLSAMQLRYAADDVRYLPALRFEIGRRLEPAGHAAWVAEECAALCEPSLYRFDPEQQYLRVRGATSLPPAGLAILRELVIWRDAAARAHDVPPRAFLRDEILLDLARNPVKTVEKLDRVKHLPRPIEVAHGREIVEAIARGLSAPDSGQPARRTHEETPTERFRADALWAAAECLAFGRGIDPNLVANRQEMGQLYRYLIGGGRSAETPDVRLLAGWRREAVGQALIDLVQGNAGLSLGWSQGALRLERGSG